MINKSNNIQTNLSNNLLVINKVKSLLPSNMARINKNYLFAQKRLFNTRSTYKNVLEYLSVILEDEKRFHAFFKKRFPKSFKYLPIVKFVIFLSIFITLKMDYQTYSALPSSILEEESLITFPPKFYSQYSFCFYSVIIIYEFVLSIYVTLKANSPIENVAFQIGKYTAKAVGTLSAVALGYSYAPVEPNVVSNFVHTKTPFGRGYDYEIGSHSLKIKGDIVSGALGHKDMVSAAQKHASDSNIININKLNNIINDSEFKSKICANTTFPEKTFIGFSLFDSFLSPANLDNDSEFKSKIHANTTFPEKAFISAPLFDSSSLPANFEGSDVSDSNSLRGDDSGTEENITPVIKRRHTR